MPRTQYWAGYRISENENGDNNDSSSERTALLMDAHVEESMASTRPLSGVEREGIPAGRRPKRSNRTSAEYGVRVVLVLYRHTLYECILSFIVHCSTNQQ